ncbi:MAG: sodium pump decarboxylase subunit gamma [Chloroflexi bacterium]|nr:sodium pump decarboxylase subunit gamma [Chloroflexota bacterium]
MDDLAFGVQVSALGLGLVFGLLAFLWLLLTLASRLEPRQRVAEVAPAGIEIRAADGEAEIEPTLVAAIAVAVSQHVELRRRQAAPAMRTYWPGSLMFASRWVAAGRMRQSQSWRRRRS